MSLSIYYTGAAKFTASQNDASKSIGGYISSSIIPNGMLSNLFGDISAYTKSIANRSEYRAIAIKSTSAPTKSNLKAYFTYPQSNNADSNVCDYQIGYLSPQADQCGDLMTELLSSIYAQPYTVSFSPAVGLANALQLPNLDNNNYLVLYIKRTLKTSFVEPLTIDQYVAIMNKTLVLDIQENISLTFDWS